MAALIVRLDDKTLDRLTSVAESYGTDVNTIIGKLLDGPDVHDHAHRCPTCARIADREIERRDAEMFGQESLFEEADDSWLPATP